MSLRTRIRDNAARLIAESGLTHVEILRRARERGFPIPDTAISQVLKGSRRADTYADAIAAGLGVDVSWLTIEPR